MTEFEEKAKEMCEYIIQHYEADIIYQSDPFEYCYKLAKTTMKVSPFEAPVMLNFAEDEKIILQSLIRLKILEVQQEIDKDIFASINQQNSLVNKIQELQKILSKISA